MIQKVHIKNIKKFFEQLHFELHIDSFLNVGTSNFFKKLNQEILQVEKKKKSLPPPLFRFYSL